MALNYEDQLAIRESLLEGNILNRTDKIQDELQTIKFSDIFDNDVNHQKGEIDKPNVAEPSYDVFDEEGMVDYGEDGWDFMNTNAFDEGGDLDDIISGVDKTLKAHFESDEHVEDAEFAALFESEAPIDEVNSDLLESEFDDAAFNEVAQDLQESLVTDADDNIEYDSLEESTIIEEAEAKAMLDELSESILTEGNADSLMESDNLDFDADIADAEWPPAEPESLMESTDVDATVDAMFEGLENGDSEAGFNQPSDEDESALNESSDGDMLEFRDALSHELDHVNLMECEEDEEYEYVDDSDDIVEPIDGGEDYVDPTDVQLVDQVLADEDDDDEYSYSDDYSDDVDHDGIPDVEEPHGELPADYSDEDYDAYDHGYSDEDEDDLDDDSVVIVTPVEESEDFGLTEADFEAMLESDDDSDDDSDDEDDDDSDDDSDDEDDDDSDDDSDDDGDDDSDDDDSDDDSDDDDDDSDDDSDDEDDDDDSDDEDDDDDSDDEDDDDDDDDDDFEMSFDDDDED